MKTTFLVAVLMGVSAFILPPPASVRGRAVNASVPYTVTTSEQSRYVFVTVTF
jgi:hypothetical protein